MLPRSLSLAPPAGSAIQFRVLIQSLITRSFSVPRIKPEGFQLPVLSQGMLSASAASSSSKLSTQQPHPIFSLIPRTCWRLRSSHALNNAISAALSMAITASLALGIIFFRRTNEVSDRSQPPLTFDLSVRQPAGSGSLHRLVR